jgi:hypothetical protein
MVGIMHFREDKTGRPSFLKKKKQKDFCPFRGVRLRVLP